MSTAIKIKTARHAKNLTQQQLADATQVHVASVRNWEAGSTPRDAMLEKIADVLGVSVDYLRDEEDEVAASAEGYDFDVLLRDLAEKMATQLRVPVERVKVVATIS